MHDMDQLIKTHRLQPAYSTDDLYKFLDRGFARFMGHLVRAHQKYSNTQYGETGVDFASASSSDLLLMHQYESGMSLGSPSATKLSRNFNFDSPLHKSLMEESKGTPSNLLNMMLETQGWLGKVRTSIVEVGKELNKIRVRQDQVLANIQGQRRPDLKVTNTLLAMIEESMQETIKRIQTADSLLKDKASMMNNMSARVDEVITRSAHTPEMREMLSPQ